MANGRPNRAEGYPSLTAREHWGRYAAGIATEALFIAALIAIGFALAFAASAVYG